MFFSSHLWAANKTSFKIDDSKQRCQTPYENSKKLYMNTFSWGMTPDFMAAKFDEVYQSDERLNYHAFYDSSKNQFYLYKDNSSGIKKVRITENFIKSVTRQIEVALENGFAEHIFFPDMGHSHLYFPKKHWDDNIATLDIPTSENHKLYEVMFADPQMKALYHLSEQLQMTDENSQILPDSYLEFRFWNRNFVGANDTSGKFLIAKDPTHKHNTVGSLDGHHSYSAGFAVSASHKGCFPYTDKDGSTKYFDISLKDPEYNPDQFSSEPGL